MRPLHISLVLIERTPYHDLLINELINNNINLDVYYLQTKSKGRPWIFSSIMPTSYYINTFRSLFNTIFANFFKHKPDFVIVGDATDSKTLLLIVLMGLLKIRFAYTSDTPRMHFTRPWAKEKVRRIILAYLFNHAEAILATGEVGMRAYAALGCPEGKLRNFPFAVDLQGVSSANGDASGFARELQTRYAPTDETIFLCLGRLEPRKGFDLAIQAFKEALAMSQPPHAVLLVAGDGPQKGALLELIETLGLGGKVHLLGWRQPAEIKALLSMSNALVHPALWDPYPNAILEAMAWRLPILASDQTMSAADRVQHGVSGFIHGVGNISELASHMCVFLEDPGVTTLMGAQARKTAEEWPASHNVQTILSLIKSNIGNKAP